MGEKHDESPSSHRDERCAETFKGHRCVLAAAHAGAHQLHINPYDEQDLQAEIHPDSE